MSSKVKKKSSSSRITTSFREAKMFAPRVSKTGKPVLFRGQTGIGKSELVYQIAKVLPSHLGLSGDAYADGMPIVERRLSQCPDAGDLTGLPEIRDGRTYLNPMAWFARLCTEPCILFADEIDRALPDVRQAFFELTDSRKVSGVPLHPKTVIYGAINGGGDHSSNYQVGEMDPAEQNRWTIFDLDPTVEEWLEYASLQRVNPMITEFIGKYHEHLEFDGENFIPGKIYPTRRSWFRLNEVILEEELEDPKAHFTTLVNAYVGQEAALAFYEFARNYSREVSVEDIITRGKFDRISSWKQIDYTKFMDKLNNHKILTSKNLTEDQKKNFAQLFRSLSKETQATAFQNISAKHPNFWDMMHDILKSDIASLFANSYVGMSTVSDKE